MFQSDAVPFVQVPKVHLGRSFFHPHQQRQLSPMPHDLPSLLTARLAHDLANPLGAIGNGLELLEMSQPDKTPELELLRQATTTATARLRFFRLAFGGKKTVGYSIPHILTDWSEIAKSKVEFDGDPEICDLQLFCLVLLCLDACLPHGGTLHIKSDADGLAAQAIGKIFHRSEHLWKNAKAHQAYDQLLPAHVQFPLLGKHIKSAEYQMEFQNSETVFQVKVRR